MEWPLLQSNSQMAFAASYMLRCASKGSDLENINTEQSLVNISTKKCTLNHHCRTSAQLKNASFLLEKILEAEAYNSPEHQQMQAIGP